MDDPAQLPAVSGVDIFGTFLWHKFRLKRATDPILSEILVKIREGICDTHVSQVLRTKLAKRDIDAVDMDKTLPEQSVIKLMVNVWIS